MDALTNKGSCHCGAITFGFTGEALNTYFCCCTQCQRLSGSDKLLLTAVPAEQFKLLSGSPRCYARIGDSGHQLVYHFCENCGFTLYAKPAAVNFIAIAVSGLDKPETFTPRMAIHTASLPDWGTLPEGLPVFAGTPHA